MESNAPDNLLRTPIIIKIPGTTSAMQLEFASQVANPYLAKRLQILDKFHLFHEE